MVAIRKAIPEDALDVRRVGESVWILRPREALESRSVGRLRDVFLEAVDSGALQIVVDLSEVDAVAPEGAATLRAMADHLLGRNGGALLAAPWPSGDGHALRPIEK